MKEGKAEEHAWDSVSLSTMWVPGTKIKSSSLVASTFTLGIISWAPVVLAFDWKQSRVTSEGSLHEESHGLSWSVRDFLY